MHFSHFLSIFLYIYIFLALFTFVSRRHRGSPSGLTFYVDGIQNIRLMHFSHFLSIYSALFTFVSRRHRGSPFGLTFYIDGIQNIRLSSCCEYKHRPGHKVGGKNSQFGLVAVQGAAPCYKYVLLQAWESCADWRNYADCRVKIRGKTVSMYIFDIKEG